MKKPKSKFVLAVITLSMLLGLISCVKSSGGVYKVYARPYPPKAITEPSEVFLKCDDNPNRIESDYYCIDKDHLSQLREWVIRTNSVLDKWEHQAEVLNSE